MDQDALDKLGSTVRSLRWYHTIDLGNGVVTPGDYDLRPYLDRYGIPEDLTGQTALDIGAASGFFSFELERRGARVTATELSEWADHDLGPRYQPELIPGQLRHFLNDPFEVAKSALGSRVERTKINVYDISPERLGLFDLVFCGSVLLHLTDPFRALLRIRSVTRRLAIIATAIQEDAGDAPQARFIGHPEAYTWWLPNRSCLETMARSAGFAKVEWRSTFRLDYPDGRAGLPHGVIHAWAGPQGPREAKKSEIPFGHIDTPGEGTVALGDGLDFKGWALDDVEVRAVLLEREPVEDETRRGTAGEGLVEIGSSMFVEGTRPDIVAIYGAYPDNNRAAWEFRLERSMLPRRGRGMFRIHVTAVDRDGHRATLGVRTVAG